MQTVKTDFYARTKGGRGRTNLCMHLRILLREWVREGRVNKKCAGMPCFAPALSPFQKAN